MLLPLALCLYGYCLFRYQSHRNRRFSARDLKISFSSQSYQHWAATCQMILTALYILLGLRSSNLVKRANCQILALVAVIHHASTLIWTECDLVCYPSLVKKSFIYISMMFVTYTGYFLPMSFIQLLLCARAIQSLIPDPTVAPVTSEWVTIAWVTSALFNDIVIPTSTMFAPFFVSDAAIPAPVTIATMSASLCPLYYVSYSHMRYATMMLDSKFSPKKKAAVSEANIFFENHHHITVHK